MCCKQSCFVLRLLINHTSIFKKLKIFLNRSAVWVQMQARQPRLLEEVRSGGR